MQEILENIGLTKAESKVYFALFDLRESTIGPIAKKSGVSYSKIQLLLDKLIEKGLASYIIKNKVKYFSPTNPAKIFDYLERKKEEIIKQEKDAKELIEKLSMKILNPTMEKVEILEGYEGLKSAYDEGLTLLDKGDEALVLGASLGYYTDGSKYSKFFDRINLLRQEKGIRYRLIYNENVRGQEGVKVWQKLKNTHVKFLFENTPASINIHANRTMIIYWAKDNPKVFLITSDIVTDSFKKYFQELWKIAKK